MAKVLVTGGTGVLGSYLVPRLTAEGHHVRRLSRRATGDGAVRGDVRTGAGIDAAVAECDTVVHAATNLRRARATEVEGTRHVVDAARKVGAHVIYVSIVGVDRHRLPYYKAKWEAEHVVESSGARWSILRATQFHDLLNRVLAMRVATMPPRTPFQPVDGGEVADALIDLVDAGPSGRAPDIGGPQVLTIKELNEIRARVTGRRAVVVPIPAMWFVKDFAAGIQTLHGGRTGNRTWEEWLRTS